MNAPWLNDGDVTVHAGDCTEVMATLDEASIDVVITDPPYGLEFMGREWDSIGRNVGPGGKRRERERLIEDRADGKWQPGSTYGAHAKNPRCQHCHRLRFDHTDRKCACAVPLFHARASEYGAAMQEWHIAWTSAAMRVLRPGGHLLAFGGTRTFHRLTCGLEDAGFEIRDVLTWLYGSGFPKSHNLDGEHAGRGTALKPAWEPIILARKPLAGTVAHNVTEHGTGALNIDAARIGTEGARSNGGSGKHGTVAFGDYGPTAREDYGVGRWPANVAMDEDAAALLDAQATGGPSRFFYTGKASRKDRGEGNTHPTVKPSALMRWLVRLATPPGGVILDPFAGSGTTGVAAIAEGRRVILIERDPEYLQIIAGRLSQQSLFATGG